LDGHIFDLKPCKIECHRVDHQRVESTGTVYGHTAEYVVTDEVSWYHGVFGIRGEHKIVKVVNSFYLAEHSFDCVAWDAVTSNGGLSFGATATTRRILMGATGSNIANHENQYLKCAI